MHGIVLVFLSWIVVSTDEATHETFLTDEATHETFLTDEAKLTGSFRLEVRNKIHACARTRDNVFALHSSNGM